MKVSIVGEEFTIRSDETPEHTRAVAEHVDRAIKQVLNTSPVIEM
ncbi:MAG: cell division protein ZapA, partial [Gemmatimonadetes bacterium]|nr:cell division protein ZapA [Gemmatimonadota bacterium]